MLWNRRENVLEVLICWQNTPVLKMLRIYLTCWVFLMLLHVFQRVQRKTDKSEYWRTLHLLPEHTFLLLLFLLLLVFLFCNSCLWTITLDTTGDHEQYPHPRSPKPNALRKYHKGRLLAPSTWHYARSQNLYTMHLLYTLQYTDFPANSPH